MYYLALLDAHRRIYRTITIEQNDLLYHVIKRKHLPLLMYPGLIGQWIPKYYKYIRNLDRDYGLLTYRIKPGEFLKKVLKRLRAIGTLTDRRLHPHRY